MKAFIVLTIGRQVDGELISVNVEKGFLDSKKADQFVSKLSQSTVTTMKTGADSIQLVCERGIFEVEIEE